MHGALCARFDDEPFQSPENAPLALADYVADPWPKIFAEHIAVGMPLPDMPLFLNPDRYVNVPFEETYQTTWRGFPAFWRGVVEGIKSY